MTRIARLFLFLIFLTGCSTAIAQGVTPFADVLVWHPSEETSSVWSSAVTLSESLNTFSPANVQFDWNAGFRIGLAHRRDRQSWDAKLYWTSFRSSADAAYPVGGQLTIPEFFSGFISGDAIFFDGAKLDWGFTFNTVDFELGRTIAVGRSVSVRPSLGIKAAFIDQDIRTHWTSSLGVDAVERVDHDFRGAGPSFGIDGRWILPRYGNLSLVGSFSGAFLWGTWNVEDTYERTDPTYPLFAYGAFTTSMKDSSLGTVNLNYFLGLEWVRPGNVVTITGRLGYELQWWANQQRLTTFQQLPMHGDLTLQGLTCGIALGF